MINVKSMKGSQLCEAKRSRNIEVKTHENPNYRRVTEEKNIIKKFKYLPQIYTSMEECMDACVSFMASEHELCEITRNQRTNEMKSLVRRYLSADPRTCAVPDTFKFKYRNEEYCIKPDFVYEGETTILAKPKYKAIKWNKGTRKIPKKRDLITVPEIEIVHLSAAKTKMSNSLRSLSLDTGMFSNMTVFGSVMLGVSLLNGREGIVKVTFDSLKSASDTKGDFTSPWKVCERSQTAKKTDNSVSLEFAFSKKGQMFCHQNTGPFFFERIDKAIDQYNSSQTCTKSECEKCERFPICNYNHPPKAKDEVIIEKKLGDISLTGQQEAVIKQKEGIARVLAGPGSGKTFCMIQRIVRLIQTGSIPKNILVTTFSRAGIQEIRERLYKEFRRVGLKANPNDVVVSNFNSLGNTIIEKYYKELGFSEVPILLDEVEEKSLISEIIAETNDEISGLDYRNPLMKFSKNAPKGIVTYLYDEFNLIRSNAVDNLEDYTTLSKENSVILLSQEDYAKVWSMHQIFTQKMKEKCYIDYADQSNLVMDLIIKGDETGKRYVTDLYNFEHIIVDEFQDSNDFQMEFIRELISAPKFVSLMCVGDDKQAIYGFRGTSPKNIMEMEKLLEVETEDLMLNKTHRFPQPIADVGNFIIGFNKKQVKSDVVSITKGGQKPLFRGFEDTKTEYKYIARAIKTLVDDGVEPSDIAVISSKNSTLQGIGKELTELEVLAMKNTERLLDNSRVIAAINLCEYLNDVEATASLMIYLNAFLDNKLMNMSDSQINSMIETNKEDFINLYLPLTMEEKKDVLMNLLGILDDGTDDTYSQFYDKLKQKTRYSAQELIEYVLKFKLYGSDDRAERLGNYNSVELTTAHGSKGKEWKYVFVSMSDFDHISSKKEDIEERRRLLFVAVTRAKEFLMVTSIREIKSDTDNTKKKLHRFYGEFHGSLEFQNLFDIEEHFLSDENKKNVS